jgi:ADP-ribose pyrophosphatase YjhB (NUDIX family)
MNTSSPLRARRGARGEVAPGRSDHEASAIIIGRNPFEQRNMIAGDFQEFPFRSNGQEWLVAWHPASLPPPDGTLHGSAAICFTPNGDVVLVTEDGETWGLPGGRPEGDEDWRITLDREVLEEACAMVERATLLGFSRGVCTSGPQQGLVLVRSFWRAEVNLLPWQPDFEITGRLLVSPDRALAILKQEPQPLFPRLFREALNVQPQSRQ